MEASDNKKNDSSGPADRDDLSFLKSFQPGRQVRREQEPDIENLLSMQALNNKLLDTQRELQREKRIAEIAIREKEDFLSRMSHDIRTPLNGILGFTEIALGEQDEGKRLEYLRKIQASGYLLRDIVNDVLELFRVESGKTAVDVSIVDCRKILENVMTAVSPLAQKRNISLIENFGDKKEDFVSADGLKLQKVLLNLLSNAIKYTPQGGKVRCSMERIKPSDEGGTQRDEPSVRGGTQRDEPSAKGGAEWDEPSAKGGTQRDKSSAAGCTRRFIVEDNGIGMSPEFLEKLYQPFSQEQRKEAEGTVGTGLGLAIVRQLVDLMGGKISVESELGKGSCFSVELPLPDALKPKKDVEEKKNADQVLKGKHILLCEDNETNAEIAAFLLERRGVKFERAADGKEGLEKFSRSGPGTYDAILMDIRMPVMGGFEASESIRSLERPDAKGVPIIAMTADAFGESVEKAKESGMNDYITKPIEPEKLYAVLEKIWI